ncbi:hypothetical protein GOODEAATRI_028242 [Goodea atripinnis]|uniref:Uncharacterized protein n=1 Tax=Goodea atripinnis TaxID=208336 RepID=A0ABV0MVU1_9TELE
MADATTESKRSYRVSPELQSISVSIVARVCSDFSCEEHRCCGSCPVYCSGEHPGTYKSSPSQPEKRSWCFKEFMMPWTQAPSQGLWKRNRPTASIVLNCEYDIFLHISTIYFIPNPI